MKDPKQKPVVIRIAERDRRNAEKMVAYVFDRQGNLLESSPVKNGEVSLKITPDTMRGHTRLLFAQALPEEFKDRPVLPETLKKYGAWQPSLKIPSTGIIELPFFPELPILPFQWRHVTGSVSKTFYINGHPFTFPICHARVHICEVDKIRIRLPYIPDYIIKDVIHRVIKIQERVPVIIKKPIPEPDPRTVVQIENRIQRKTILNSARLNAMESPLPPLPSHVIEAFQTASTVRLRELISEHLVLLHPYFCLWPIYWYWFYSCEHLTTVETDCHGRFDANIFTWGSDKPDIYVWVEVLINGIWQRVYHPRKPCGTHWDYVSGTDINIHITDPRVGIATCDCESLQGQYIWIKQVNYGTSIRKIQQHTGASGHLGNAQGLTDYGTSGRISPFALDFPFVLQFGDAFPMSTATHYRWRYKRIKDAFLNPVSFPQGYCESPVSRPYQYVVGGSQVAVGQFDMGPTYNASKPKYKIPHDNAAVDSGVAGAEWPNADISSIHIQSAELADGVYEFIFELLDNAGNVVAVPADTYIVDRLTPHPTNQEIVTETADGLSEGYVIKDSAGNATGFKFVMRIDNMVCYADVLDALVDGATTDTQCGVGRYDAAQKDTDLAQFRFLAGHPNDFATYVFRVTKGNSNFIAAASVSDEVTQVNNGYAVNTILVAGQERDLFDKELTVGELLGTCTIAAFAENLYVYGTHTNGNTRISNYDREDTGAIAIAPREPAA